MTFKLVLACEVKRRPVIRAVRMDHFRTRRIDYHVDYLISGQRSEFWWSTFPIERTLR